MGNFFSVPFAVYGALNDGNENQSDVADVSAILQQLLNSSLGSWVITINNSTMGGDPAPGNTKSFGAVIQTNGQTYVIACTEGQTINFGYWCSSYQVNYALYGALKGGNENQSDVSDVTFVLQQLLIGTSGSGIVTINNTNMGGDPSPGDTKSFGASLTINGYSCQLACAENQTIEFSELN